MEQSRQIAAAREASATLSTPERATAAGYSPVFGFSPMMGVHWVKDVLIDDDEIDPVLPEVLMFMPIGGEERLVGVAYGLWQPQGSAMPEGFVGDEDRWHTHEFPWRRGEELAMVHLWFTDSPDGAFSNYNPWLPFLALDLEPPSAARLADPDEGPRLRELSLALGETIRPLGLSQFGRIRRWLGFDERLQPERDAIAALIPTLEDPDRYDAAVDEMIERWRVIEAAYLELLPTRRARQRLTASLAAMKGHGHHHDGM